MSTQTNLLNSLKVRIDSSANYRSIFIEGKTLRIAIDKTKPITELKWPEFYDVAINDVCHGKCPYCYTSATNKGKNFDDIVQKINTFFGHEDKNKRPFQVALGGAGEPTLHPQFIEVLEAFYNLGIVPNYTTNGMTLTDASIEATKRFCGGVAVTLHPHLEKFWRKALERLIAEDIETNVHFIVSDTQSMHNLEDLYKEYSGKISYFVLLPYMNTGFAANNPKTIDFNLFDKFMAENHLNGDLAVGANFYPYLLKHGKKFNLSLYPPEIFSKYVILGNEIKVYNNSFEMKEVPFDLTNGCELGHSRTVFHLDGV